MLIKLVQLTYMAQAVLDSFYTAAPLCFWLLIMD